MPTHAICVAAIVFNFISFWPKWMKKFVPAVLPKQKQVYKFFGLNFGHFRILGEMAKIKNPTEMVLGFFFKRKPESRACCRESPKPISARPE